MKKKKIQEIRLRIREKELDLQQKKLPIKYHRLIDVPCEFGGRIILEMSEGYTKDDLKKATDDLLFLLKTQCTIYKELTPEEVRNL